MSSAPTAYARDTAPLDPRCLYPYAAFIKCSGITKSRIREARLQGIEMPTINVGRRLFIRGVDAIAFIEQLAELGAK